MADKKSIANVMVKIEDDATWDSIMETSEQKLIVVDCHQDWCGCCEAMFPSMSRLLLDYDAAEERFTYCAASIGKVGAKIQKSFPSDVNIKVEENGCLPLFALYRNKSCLGVIVGVDSPTLLVQIATNIPDKPVKE